ncbi:MAG: penicillin acylase family protein [Deltaproteobacteria bacterium]|nr:penicillin acylase family protein [Deltaproteobacteria bacterium]
MLTDLRWLSDLAAPTYIPKTASDRAAGPSLENRRAIPGAGKLNTFPDLSQAAKEMTKTLEAVVEGLKSVNAYVKMGSYGWAVAGRKTKSGQPIVYTGPQMAFSVPSNVVEGSIQGGGLNVSGMSVPGIPGIIIGRTPHHAWAFQVGHAHTTDYYFESPEAVKLHRVETIKVAGQPDVTLPVYRTSHGPVVYPIPYDAGKPVRLIFSWKYAHWGYEFDVCRATLGMARARNMDEFGQALEYIAASQHILYGDRDGNIAYWMSGRDPVRAPGADPRFPQLGDGSQEWPQPVTLKPRSTDRNPAQGYYCGWNSRSSSTYQNSTNNTASFQFGPFHRAHVIDEYLSGHNNLTFEEVRDLALNIATTDSFGDGGNPWKFAAKYFTEAVRANPNEARLAALALVQAWDGHFVAGGPGQWVSGTLRADAWVLANTWILETIRLTFEDKLKTAGMTYQNQDPKVLFNVLLHALAGESSSVVNLYDWFQDTTNSGRPNTANGIIIQALDNVLANLGPQPWNQPRGFITYTHPLLGIVWKTPFASRSTYAHCVELGPNGPVRIESMFPLGESGDIRLGSNGSPVFNQDYFSMTPVFDAFAPRSFPLFN